MNSVRSRIQRAMAAIVATTLLVLVPLAAAALPAEAATAPVTGYVWANNPTSPKYTPFAQTSFNGASPTLTNSVGRNSPGIYTVTFPGMAVAGGVAHATAYGSGTRQCKVKSWGPVASGSPDLRVLVKCFDVTGALADSMFMASFTAQSGTNTQPMAYLLADRPTVASYTANQTYSYNSKGVLNTITRTGVGAYTARLGWVGGSGGHVQVTAFGDSSVRCKVARWAPVSVGFGIVHEDVSVRCFSNSGAPADSVFTLTYANNIGLNGSFDYAYMWADQPSTPSYVPSLPYQANSQPSIDAVQRLGVGHYVATFPGHPLVAGDVQVTAYGTSPTYCKVASLAAYPGVEVRCFDTHGAPVDSQFDATQFTSTWIL